MKAETSNSFLEYRDRIVFVRLKEGKEITVDSMKEQYRAQEELVKNDEYAVLVDSRHTVLVHSDTRRFMAQHNPPKRMATAIVSNDNLAMTLIANFYLKVNKPKRHTKLFRNEDEAVKWLKQKLSNS